MSLDELDRVVRERIIGSPPHSFQLLGTIERIRYLEKIGTMGVLGTVLLTVHIGTLGKVNRIGTLDEITRAGTLNRIAGGRVGTLGRLGTVHYVERIGTVQRLGTVKYLGTVRYLQAGSLGRVERLGTVARLTSQGSVGVPDVAYVRRLGTVRALGTVTRITSIGTQTARFISGLPIRDRIPLGPGSPWVGSWQDTGQFQTKTLMVLSKGAGGSLSIIAGMIGTGLAGFTGTYYGPAWIGNGSFTTKSWTEAIPYVRPLFRRSGASRGTVSVSLVRQV